MIGPRGKLNLLSQVRNPGCTKCRLHTGNSHVCLMGRGDTMAKVMLVGEAPGQEESTSGQVFVGKTGRWLMAELEKLNIHGKVYITNSVRCRPPDNRKPEPDEIRACGSHLRNEVAIIKPKCILAMGTTPKSAFNIAKSIKRGQVYWNIYYKCYMMWTWHPSFVMRFGGSDKAAYQEFIAALVAAYDAAHYWEPRE